MYYSRPDFQSIIIRPAAGRQEHHQLHSLVQPAVEQVTTDRQRVINGHK